RTLNRTTNELSIGAGGNLARRETTMMNQVEGQQKNLVHAIESLPGSGPLTALDQDLLLLKATSAATLSCLGECLNLLQQSVRQAGQPSHKPGAS
ncbi:Oxysterol-binding protein- protein 10, partial [Saguinus oedipus]